MQKRFCLIIAVVIFAAGAAVSAIPTKRFENAPKNPGAAAAKPCLRANLSLRYIDTDAAMGGVRQSSYAFKNTGAAACTLNGYPSVQLLNRSGTPIKTKVGHDTGGTPAAVELAPGKEALFNLNFNEGGAGHIGKPCPVAPRELITAPGTKQAFARREAISLCGDVTVSAVTSGAAQ